MKKLILPLIALFLLQFACNTEKKENMNPLLTEFATPYGVPPFDQIKPEHYLPAFKAAMEIHDQEIAAITGNTEAPTFENTIAAFDYSGELLNRIENIFENVRETDTNDTLQSIAKEVVPLMSAHRTNISLNEELFNRIRSVYERKDSLNLNGEQLNLVEKTYKNFIRRGASLDPEKKARLREINEKLSMLTLTFGENVLKETNSFILVIENKEDLAGLPESVISAAADDAKAAGKEGAWVFTLQKPSWIPFVTYSDRRELREKLYKAMYMRADNDNANDNKAIIDEIVNLRLEQAQLLGYDSHAAYQLEERMAKNPENVYALLMKLWDPALKIAKKEAAEMQKMIDRDGGNFRLESWDWWYYAEKVRKEKYDLDEEQLRPYFSLDAVTAGVFDVVNKLYGLTFTRDEQIPVYNPEAVAYVVKDRDGSDLGVLYMDFFPRASKNAGAWSTAFRKQYRKDGAKINAINSIVCNFSKPAGDLPALLTFDEVQTYFHEFGHALHAILSDCTYPGTSGTAVPRDFVELPSQIMENWAADPEVLVTYAKHYKTGEPIPATLIAKLEASSHFNQGFTTVEYLAASILDMDYHTLTAAQKIDANQFEKASMDRIGLISSIIPRYRSDYFSHIFAGGYSAGYYSYIWAEVLDADAFQAFKETSLYDRKTADAFRENVLSKGGTEDPMTLYVRFRGKEPSIDALLEKRGLK
ncbi:MAG: M3 family metallopeptidase [Bacteroidota bacterium]